MKDIVINATYGGFSLSYEGVMRYAELKGIKLYSYLDEITLRVYGDEATVKNPSCHPMYLTCPPKETPKENARLYNNGFDFDDTDIDRDDPVLVQVVRELGEKANGACAKLRIVEIPNHIKWCIEEYDGNEHISEIHRTWG